MMRKRIFISGKIGTYDIEKVSEECIKKFQKAEQELQKMYPDSAIFNPLEYAEHISGQTIHEKYSGSTINFTDMTPQEQERWLKSMNINILSDSTSIFLLTDWRSSTGANMEKDIAEFLGLEIIYQKER